MAFRSYLLACLAGGLMACNLAGAGIARAEDDHPQLMPRRDAVVTYDVQPDGAPAPQQVKVWFSTDGAQLRVDSPDGDASTILDRAARQVTIVLNSQKVFTRLAQQEGVKNPFLLDASMQFKRTGTATVAGIGCDSWEIVSGKGSATACVTTDGIILQEAGVDADGMKGHLTARSVSYQPIASSVFQPPAGYEEVTRHRVAPSSGVGGGPVLGPNSGAAGTP